MARPKVSVRAPVWPTDPSRAGPLRRAEGQQVTATALLPSTGGVTESSKQVSVGNSTDPVVVQHPSRPQWPAGQVKPEPIYSPALGEKLLVEVPISATISSTYPGTKGLQATGTTMWPSTRPAKEEHGHGAQGKVTSSGLPRLPRASLEKISRNLSPSPAPASIFPTTVVKGEGVDAGTSSLKISSAKSPSASVSKTRKGKRNASIVGKKPRARRIQLSYEDLVSDDHLRLKDKAAKLRVSMSLLKNRRKAAGLGRWQGRQVRAQIKSKEQAQAQAQPHA